MVRDRLFVNEEEIFAEETDEPRYDGETRRQDTRAKTRQNGQNTNSERAYGGERVFYRSKGARYQHYGTRVSDETKSVNFSVPVSNRFEPLAWKCNTPMQQMGGASASKKHPASSPLDGNYTTKKHREGHDSDTSVHDTEMVSPPRPGTATQTVPNCSATEISTERLTVSDLGHTDTNITDSSVNEPQNVAGVESTPADTSKLPHGSQNENNPDGNVASVQQSESHNGDGNSDTA